MATATTKRLTQQLARLPKAQRLKIANFLYKTIPEHGDGISVAELEKRAERAAAGKSRAHTVDEVVQEIDRRVAKVRSKAKA